MRVVGDGAGHLLEDEREPVPQLVIVFIKCSVQGLGLASEIEFLLAGELAILQLVISRNNIDLLADAQQSEEIVCPFSRAVCIRQ